MLNNFRFLAIIPARGGSKRLLKKNILDLAGKPLIQWTIDAATDSQYLDDTIISSDDHSILQVVNNINKKIKTLQRPQQLATDTASSIDVVKHAICYYRENYYNSYNINDNDFIVLLQPTSPLRTTYHIDSAIEFLFTKQADAVVSICETDHSPMWTGTLPPDYSMVNFLKNNNKQSQELQKYYRLNGAIYICRIAKLFQYNSLLFNNHCYGFVMGKQFSIDIDDGFDFQVASALLKQTDYIAAN